jgi:hypothetical protein
MRAALVFEFSICKFFLIEFTHRVREVKEGWRQPIHNS